MDDTERTLLIRLALCPWLERRTLYRLVNRFGSAKAVCESSAEDWMGLTSIREQTAKRLTTWLASEARRRAEDRLMSTGIACIVDGDAEYPLALHDLTDPPLVLFSLGLPLIQSTSNHVAVVGTRRATGYGMEAASWVAQTLAQAGCTVISGMALGIDISAHRAALGTNGATVAILASGVDLCYPPSHETVYREIRAHGQLLSEYAPGTPVAKHRFLERNRIIAALCKAIVLVQAGEKSGALRTVDYALDIGREVYVVPGPITSVNFRGSHTLLRDGAKILIDPQDMLIDLGLFPHQGGASPSAPPERWRMLYEALDEPRSAVALARMMGQPIAHVFAGVLELELAGWLERVPGGVYRRRR